MTSVPCADIPPSAPTGLTASSGDGKATLSWGPPTNGETNDNVLLGHALTQARFFQPPLAWFAVAWVYSCYSRAGGQWRHPAWP